jgi:DNA modification methylase
VTSPPYPNAYDYHLYHRFRLFWLGEQPADLRRVEIGSHLKHQAEKDPIASYEADMQAVLNNLHQLLADDRYCVLVVGDGIYSGERYPTAERLAAMAAASGWVALPTISRSLPETRRSVTSAGRRLRTEEILILRKRPEVASVRLIPPSYERFPYEHDLAAREAQSLSGSELGDDGLLRIPAELIDRATEAMTRLAFWHGFEIGSDNRPTNQRLVEDVSSGKRKHSTYATHGLHRYKGKFYPQLAKALLNLSDVEAGGAQVLDPFGGSGTVMLEASLAGHDSISIDCSPLATAVAQSKVDILRVPAERLTKAIGSLSDSLDRSMLGPIDWDQFEPATHDELGSWFAARVLEKLGRVLRTVRGLDDVRMIAFFEVILSDLIREVSHQEPRDLRIRRRKDPLEDAPVLEQFIARSEAAIAKVMALHGNLPGVVGRLGDARAVLGSSSDAETFDAVAGRSINAVVSSPPYATALPYLDTDRLSLAAVYGCDKKARSDLEARLIGSRETTRGQQRSIEALIEGGLTDELPLSTVTFLQELLDAARSDATAGFRKQQLPTVLARYFLGIAGVMQQLGPRMAVGAHLWFVLGDSRTEIGGRKWVIPTVDEVEAIAKHVGMELIETIPITVTREDVIHARHAITENAILHFRAPV